MARHPIACRPQRRRRRPPCDSSSTLCPDSPVHLVGFSMGANIVLKMAGELGDACAARAGQRDGRLPADRPDRVLAATCSSARNRLYDRSFVDRPAQAHRAAQAAGARTPCTGRSIRGRGGWSISTTHFTAPLAGFADAHDYYARASSGPLLRHIAVPTLIVTAANDPIIPVGPFETGQLFADHAAGHHALRRPPRLHRPPRHRPRPPLARLADSRMDRRSPGGASSASCAARMQDFSRPIARGSIGRFRKFRCSPAPRLNYIDGALIASGLRLSIVIFPRSRSWPSPSLVRNAAHTIKAKVVLAGKKVMCPKCQTIIAIPALARRQSPAAPTAAASRRSSSAARCRYRPPASAAQPAHEERADGRELPGSDRFAPRFAARKLGTWLVLGVLLLLVLFYLAMLDQPGRGRLLAGDARFSARRFPRRPSRWRWRELRSCSFASCGRCSCRSERPQTWDAVRRPHKQAAGRICRPDRRAG